ncbi:MAG: hypothetical protein WCB97_02160, partial [Thiobacillus sp.]
MAETDWVAMKGAAAACASPGKVSFPQAGTEPIHCDSIFKAFDPSKLPLILTMRLSLLLVMLYSSAASAADPFLVMARTLPSPAAELRPAAACETTVVTGTLTLA